MNETLMKFAELISKDAALKAQLDELLQKNDKAGIVALAASKGFEFSEEDLVIQSNEPSELSDDELDAVAGGWKECVCVLGGGGKADSDGLACACIAGGLGVGRRNKNATRCACAVSGFGESTECIMLGGD